MPHICLLLSGAALLINGLAMLGHVPRRDAASLSLVVGTIQLVLAVGYVMNDDGGAGVLPTAAGMFLFGLTYVYVGLDVLLALGSKGLGWFCGMVAFVGLLLASARLTDDPVLAVLWLCWSLLWALFFASMGLGRAEVDPYTGWALVLTSQVTATVPALLGLAGLWPASPTVAGGTAVLLMGLFFASGILARRTRAKQRMARHGEPAPERTAQPSPAVSGAEPAG